MDNSQARPWRCAEELVEIGLQRSRVVMMNEAHADDLRCIRTRVIGQRILPTAYKMGARYLAMEALWPEITEEANHTRRLGDISDGSYLSQPEMRSFIQAALDMGWTLAAYEADFRLEPPGLSYRRQNNWREEMQARNLVNTLQSLGGDAKMLVWCGNSHHAKALVPIRDNEPNEEWALMGYQFRTFSSIDPFVIEQSRTVHWPEMPVRSQKWLQEITSELTGYGGTAGFLKEEAPLYFRTSDAQDAYIVSLDNQME